MSKTTYPGIPEPGASIEALMQTVIYLKMSVELLTGQRTGPTTGAPRMFIQNSVPPTADTGDLWINTGANNKLNYWDGTRWVQTT